MVWARIAAQSALREKPHAKGILVSALASGAAAIAAGFGFGADAAEFGAGPWIKGGTDIFAGVVPSQPGFYSRTDVYHYAADVSAVVYNGRVEVGVDQEMTATLPAVTYVTPWKLFGGTYAVGIVPSIMVADVDVGIGLPPHSPVPSATASARLRWRGETLILPSAIPGLFR